MAKEANEIMSIRTFRSAAIGMLSGLALVTLQGPAVGIPLVKATGEPHPLYGREILFDVLRGGDKVGFHRVHFEKSDQGLTVRSRFELEIGFLFFAAYTFLYTSEARWVGGELKSLKASVNDNGEFFSLAAHRDQDRISIRNPDGINTTNAPLIPTNHWNAAVLSQSRVLNTLTGDINNVRITAQTREQVETEQGPVLATHYVYSGDLETEVWYDAKGRWVKMRFTASDGSTIDYRCRRCQGVPLTQSVL